jgi:hypothetical protein
VSSQFSVDLSHCVNFVFYLLSIEGVEVDSDVLLSIESNSGSLSGDSSGENLFLSILVSFTIYPYNVFKKSFMN